VVPKFNEAALASVLADVKFVEAEVKRLGKEGLDHVFDEVKLVSRKFRFKLIGKSINIVLSDAVSAYMEPSIRQMSYAAVRPVRLANILLKLSRGAAAMSGPAALGRSERRRREADEVAKLAPRPTQ
jgi:hypothetical protein